MKTILIFLIIIVFSCSNNNIINHNIKEKKKKKKKKRRKNKRLMKLKPMSYQDSFLKIMLKQRKKSLKINKSELKKLFRPRK